MKQYYCLSLIIVLLISTTSLFAATSVVIYATNFESPSYTAGQELVGQEGWLGDQSRAEWFGYVLEDPTTPDGDGQCVYMECINYYNHPIDTLGYTRLKYSGWFKLLSTGNALGINFQFHNKIKAVIQPEYGNGVCKFRLNNEIEIRDDANAALDQWIYASYTVDLATKQFLEAEFGSFKTNFTELFYTDPISSASEIRLGGWNHQNTNSALQFDSLKVEYIPKASTAGIVVSPTRLELGTDVTQSVVNIHNSGTDTFNYSVSVIDSPAWITLEKTEGTVTESDTCGFYLNRSLMGDDYYRVRL